MSTSSCLKLKLCCLKLTQSPHIKYYFSSFTWKGLFFFPAKTNLIQPLSMSSFFVSQYLWLFSHHRPIFSPSAYVKWSFPFGHSIYTLSLRLFHSIGIASISEIDTYNVTSLYKCNLVCSPRLQIPSKMSKTMMCK